MLKIFSDRVEAGKLLADELKQYIDRKDTLVLALPRGGVPVGFEIAKKLHVPLDVFLVRKLGTPGQEELAMGAIASGGVQVFNEDIIRTLNIPKFIIDSVIEQETEVINKRNLLYRGDHPFPTLKDLIVILVDDGIATGATVRAAIQGIKQLGSSKIIVATPVAPPSTVKDLTAEADEIVCLETPEPFYAIGAFYQDFSQTSDEEVCELLKKARSMNHGQ